MAKMNTCLGEVDVEAMHKLEKCLIGTTMDYYESRTIMEIFRISGVFDITVKKISGRQFLIEFEDDEVRNTMESQGWTWLKEWFIDIEPWSIFSYA
ncbi:hypothetical protein REPUB_Repub09cG0170500 [Reevesia pubescens]